MDSRAVRKGVEWVEGECAIDGVMVEDDFVLGDAFGRRPDSMVAGI